MNREIKFKAWNKVNNTMHQSINSAENWSFHFLSQDIFTWLQFTGLKDKNGKDIYEGDIIVSKSWGGVRTFKPYHVVKWDKCGWKAEGYNGSMKVSPDLTVRGDFEIIGNIYENKDLL